MITQLRLLVSEFPVLGAGSKDALSHYERVPVLVVERPCEANIVERKALRENQYLPSGGGRGGGTNDVGTVCDSEADEV